MIEYSKQCELLLYVGSVCCFVGCLDMLLVVPCLLIAVAC